MTEKKWSEYQKQIFLDFAKSNSHTVIQARAGAAKTTSIIEGLKFIPKNKKTLLVAFNKSIADELKERAPKYQNLVIRTMHSLGFAAIKNKYGKSVVLDFAKTNKTLKEILPDKFKNSIDLLISLERCVSLAKSYLFDTVDKLEELIDEFQIDICDLSEEEYIKIVLKVLHLHKKDVMNVNFDDMIYLCVVYNIPLEKYDFALIDEAQDLSIGQIYMVYSSCKTNGKIVMVGDDFQSIYKFRGGINAIPTFCKNKHPKILPLPISYRCSQKVIEIAQTLVPDIKARDGAAEGSVNRITEKQMLKFAKPGDFILSRTNAPLIKFCMAFIKLGVKSNIKGRDIGENLNYMIKKSNCKSVESFVKWVEKWAKEEIFRLQGRGRDCLVITDKRDCILTLCEGASSLTEVKKNISELFDDDNEGRILLLSSVHKSKGLERERVFVLEDTLKYSSQEEKNICYVAFTRAKKDLFLVSNRYFMDQI